MARVVLGLGSNLGDRGRLLRSAVDALRAQEGVEVEGVSPVVATRPVGGPPDQPDFLNAVVRITTTLSPFQLLGACQRIEADHDRERTVRWGPRTVDLDIIDYDGLEMDEPTLTLPHALAAQRAFVLVPWSLLEPQALLRGRPVAELAERAPDRSGISARTSSLEQAPGPAQDAAPDVRRELDSDGVPDGDSERDEGRAGR